MAHGIAIPPYHDLHVAVMGHELPPQRGEGWLEPETDPHWGVFRWSTGKSSLQLYAVPGPQRLCVRVGVPVPALAKTMTVQVNGRTVWRGHLGPGAHLLRIDLPPEAARGDVLHVALLCRRTVPAHWEGGPDRRALGLLVQRVWVESAGGAPFHPAPLGSPIRDAWHRLTAGRREANPVRVGGARFALWAAPAFGLCLVAGALLRPLRILGLSPRVPLTSTTSTAQEPLWRPAPQDDIPALRHHLSALAAEATAGRWQRGSALDRWTHALWRRLRPSPGKRIAALGRAAPQTAALIRAHFGAPVLGLDDSLAGVQAARRAGEACERQMAGLLAAWPVKGESLDIVEFTEEVLPAPEWSAWLREAHRALRPGGRLLVRGVSSDRRGTWPALKHRLTRGRVGTPASLTPPRSVSPGWLREALEREGFAVDHMAFIHGPFTAGFDEVFAVRRPPAWLARLATLADEPWRWGGRGARFAIIAVRRPETR